MWSPTLPCQDWRGRGEWLKRKLFGSRKREYNSHFLVARSPCRACAAFKNARGAGRLIQANEREAGGLLVAPRAGAERGNIGRRAERSEVGRPRAERKKQSACKGAKRLFNPCNKTALFVAQTKCIRRARGQGGLPRRSGRRGCGARAQRLPKPAGVLSA